jgi:hypothetical protein
LDELRKNTATSEKQIYGTRFEPGLSRMLNKSYSCSDATFRRRENNQAVLPATK